MEENQSIIDRSHSHGTLLRFDFNSPTIWKPNQISGAGTIDVMGGFEGSCGIVLSVDEEITKGIWRADLSSGCLLVENTETELNKLTLSFDLSASSPCPVKIRVESYDAEKHSTGCLERSIYPTAANFYQRYAIELSTMKAIGDGIFDPVAPYVGITFSICSEDGWKGYSRHEVHIDNVHYAKPAFYVSPRGNDENDGRTEQTAFATPQKAVDEAFPGDIILLMNGTYTKDQSQLKAEQVVEFIRPGLPSGWITLKNYPDHSPVLSSAGQMAIQITKDRNSSEATLAYIEVRGLHIRGNGDTARQRFPDEIGLSTPNTDSQGIRIDGTGSPHNMVHHIRLANNVIEFCTSDGIYIERVDWLYVEENIIRNNCWTGKGFAPSGITVMQYANFDSADNVHKFLIARNQISGNRLYVFNSPYGKDKEQTSFYNGNGILLDANGEKPPMVYFGRTLVQNNLVFNNGAGGIQMWGSHRLDIVNNTVHLNGMTPEIKWGQVGLELCRDVRLINNIIVSQPDVALDTWYPHRPDAGTTGIVRLNNLYYGGVKPPVTGINDLITDPQFNHPSSDPVTADFHLKAGSSAVGSGSWESITPPIDIDGNVRPQGKAPGLGAYQ